MFKRQTCCSWDEVFLPLNTKKTFQNIPLFRHNILIPSGTRKQVMTTQEKGLNTLEDKSNRVLFFKAKLPRRTNSGFEILKQSILIFSRLGIFRLERLGIT